MSVSPELLASQLVPETLKEQELTELVLLGNFTHEQQPIVHELLVRMMQDGIIIERVLSAGTSEVLTINDPPVNEAEDVEKALRYAEMRGFKRGLDAHDRFFNRGEQ